MNNKDKQLSKILSWLLRHGAIKEKLRISSEGYISVQAILEHKTIRGKYNLGDIKRVVNTNDKQRFKLRNNPTSNDLEIKANQGHTIEKIGNSELTPIVEPKYKTVVHGTYHKHWQQIKTNGLSRVQRNHIHFAKGTLSDPNIISGLRKDVEIYIFLDLVKALQDGIKFYESENGVILTEGNEEGFVECKYFLKVVEIGTGFPGYTQPQDLTRIFSTYGSVCVDRLTKKFAVLEFSNEDEAEEAIEDSNKVNIYGEFLTVTPYIARVKPESPKEEFTRSKQKDVIIEPQLIDLSGDFHQQLDSVLGAVRLTQEEVTALSKLYADLESVLQQQWPGCIAMPFGSITTGLGIKTSDADCFINVPPVYRHPNGNFVNKAKRILQQHPDLFAEILAIPRANTPIVKFFHVPTETNCDVTFKTPLGAQNSKLIAFLLHADPRLIPMAVTIKYWAKVHGFSGTGKLTNYALTMLIIFYLQQPPVSILPSVQWLQRDEKNDIIIDYWNTGFMHKHELLPKSTNTSSISELLGGFFQYYSTFNFTDMMVCPFMGCPIKKYSFRDVSLLPIEFERYKENITNRLVMPLRFTTSMCVQDPFELCHNVASPISSRLAAEIKAFFTFAATTYDKEKLNGFEGFLKTILLEKPKLPRGKLNPEYRAVLYPHMLQNIINPDWKSVVREVILNLFEKICKIKMSRVEEKANNESKKQRESYSGSITKPIWKRKRFSKLYNLMQLDFLQRQIRITEEIIHANKHTYNLQFNLNLTFTLETRNVAVTIKMTEGDATLFREFGKFFVTVMQNWYIIMLKPYLRDKKIPNLPVDKEDISNVDRKKDNLNASVSKTDESDSSVAENDTETLNNTNDTST